MRVTEPRLAGWTVEMLRKITDIRKLNFAFHLFIIEETFFWGVPRGFFYEKTEHSSG